MLETWYKYNRKTGESIKMQFSRSTKLYLYRDTAQGSYSRVCIISKTHFYSQVPPDQIQSVMKDRFNDLLNAVNIKAMNKELNNG